MLELQYKNVVDIYNLRYDKNAKLHSIGDICASIEQHGFRVPMIYDSTLDAIIAGNGRSEALYQMYNSWLLNKSKPIPNGIKVENDQWFAPVIYGGDAKTVQDAIAFLIDDNNLTVMGGDLTAGDISRMWDMDGYLELIRLSNLQTVSVDGNDLRVLQQIAAMSGGEGYDLGGNKDIEPDLLYHLRLTFDSMADKNKFLQKIRGIENLAQTLLELL